MERAGAPPVADDAVAAAVAGAEGTGTGETNRSAAVGEGLPAASVGTAGGRGTDTEAAGGVGGGRTLFRSTPGGGGIDVVRVGGGIAPADGA
ncbi:MAG: hypothetical protein ACFCGT_04300, partial [Sandaracinaceae bacterium]